MTTVICTDTERDLILAGTPGPIYLVVMGDPAEPERLPDDYDVLGLFVAPQRWVDATGLCEICDDGWGTMRLRPPHPDCIDGRKRVALAATCPTCGGDGGAFDRPCQTCFEWTGLMEGRVVFAHATVEVLPVPTEAEMLTWLDRPLDPPPDHIDISDTCAGELTAFLVRGDDECDPIDLDPLPVPGRDFVVALSGVELAQ